MEGWDGWDGQVELARGSWWVSWQTFRGDWMRIEEGSSERGDEEHGLLCQYVVVFGCWEMAI